MPDNKMNPVIGIDLGTTFSSIARWDGERPEVYRMHEGTETLPSIVHIQEGGVPLVGEHARKRLRLDPENTIEKAKRYIGDDTKKFALRGHDYTPVDISKLILERLAHDVSNRYPPSAGFDIAGVVVTHPHYFNYNQIARTQEAANQAGLHVIRLIAEPVAAALDYGFKTYARTDQAIQETILVFDLGGGTFDVTVIEITNEAKKLTFKVLSTGGDDMLGGTNFDEEFAQWALRQANISLDGVDDRTRRRAQAALMEAVIATKLDLSATPESYLTVPYILPNVNLELTVTVADFNEIIKPYCDRIRNILSDTLARANLANGKLKKSLLVGGSSLIPIMRQIVHEETDVEPWADGEPLLAVCRGAAFLAAMEDNRIEKKEIVVEEVTAHALGVKAVGGRFATIIPANCPAPVQATKLFEIHNDTKFDVEPYQGHGQFITDPGLKALKTIHITDVKLDDNGKAVVKITFTVNNQQLLFVKIEAPGICEERQLDF